MADDTTTLDETRTWVKITDSNGHELTVEDHPGGSRAHCDACGEWVDYGGYVHDPVGQALDAAKLAEARALVDGADHEVADHEVTVADQGASSDRRP